MLDTDASLVRGDRLREFVEERKENAEQRRESAVEDGQRFSVSEATGEIEAFETVLQYLDARAEDDGGPSLDTLR